jgi:ApaG protein
MTTDKRDFPLHKSTPYMALTRGIRVHVVPQFSPEHSNIEAGIFMYLYTVTLSNESKDTVQLLSRHWEITDGLGHTEHVVGDGVIGQKPIIAPDAHFSYTSSCPLKTPSGQMKGTYQMRNSNNDVFDVVIPEFNLSDIRLMN